MSNSLSVSSGISGSLSYTISDHLSQFVILLIDTIKRLPMKQNIYIYIYNQTVTQKNDFIKILRLFSFMDNAIAKAKATARTGIHTLVQIPQINTCYLQT